MARTASEDFQTKFLCRHCCSRPFEKRTVNMVLNMYEDKNIHVFV